MDRLRKFHSLESHPWYNKYYKKLTKKDLQYCVDFIEKHNHLDFNDFTAKTNRMFLDMGFSLLPKSRQKRLVLLQELIFSSNKGE